MTYASEVLADTPALWHRMNSFVTTSATVSVASASTFFSSDPPSQAFDGDLNTPWTTNNVSTGWLQAQMSTAIALTDYSITSRSGFATRAPNTWTFLGSNDGSTWTTLDSQSGVTWAGGDTKSYAFTNTTAYLYYRLNVTANNGSTYLGVNELHLPLGFADASTNLRDLAVVSGTAPTATSGGPVMSTAGEWGSSAGFVRTTYTQGQPAVGTFEAWVYVASNPSADLCLQAWAPNSGTSGTTSAVYLLSTGKIRLYIFNGSVVTLDAPSALSTSNWHHVVCSWGAAGSKIRIDKSTVASAGTTSATNAATSSFRLHGFYTGSADNAQTGAVKLAESAFYAAQLTDTRTDAHYNASPIASGGTVTPPAATATAAAVVPVVSAASGVTGVAATATAAAAVPVVSSSSTVTAVAATASAAAVVPTVAGHATVVAPVATASASALVPSVSGTDSVSVSPPAATATAAALAPSLVWGANLSAVAASATSAALAPTLSASATIAAVPATATASALAPGITSTNPDATVLAVPATATAAAVAPIIYAVIGTDTSNAFTGRQRGGLGLVTQTAPVASPSASQTVKYDKAVAYPTPVMVNGRPT